MALLVAGLGLMAAPPRMTAADAPGSLYKPVLPADVFAKLVAEDAKVIKDTLAKGADKKTAVRVRSSALMIAVYAQSEMNRPGAKVAELGGLRDTALKLAKAADDGKFDEAKKLADDLKPQGKADAGAKPQVAVHEAFEIDVLMNQFKPEKGGGLDLEKNLLKVTMKRPALTPAELSQAVPWLYRTTMIAPVCEAMAPEKDMGKKTRAGWIKLTQEMGQYAKEAAELASKPKPDDKAVKRALKNLEASCTNCHSTYRDE
jgi:hypothetical protein